VTELRATANIAFAQSPPGIGRKRPSLPGQPLGDRASAVPFGCRKCFPLYGVRSIGDLPTLSIFPFRKILPLNHLPDSNTGRTRSRTRTRSMGDTRPHEPQLELDRAPSVPDVFSGGPARRTCSLLIYRHSRTRPSSRRSERLSGGPVPSPRSRLTHRYAISLVLQAFSGATPRRRRFGVPHTTLHLRKAQGAELRSAP